MIYKSRLLNLKRHMGRACVANRCSSIFNFKQEGWLSPTERASVSAISLITIWLPQESRRYVVAFTRFAGGGIWLRQQSLKTHFGLPWVRPWDNRGKC